MICKNCNKKIKDDSLFCPHCGLIPNTSSNSSNETIIYKQKPLENERLQKILHYILPFLSIGVICLWFCKTISLNAGSNSGLYSIDLPLSFLLKGFALLSVGLAVVSLAIRIFLLVKKDKRNMILYSVSTLSDVVSLGCIVFKLLDVKSIVANGIYENLSSAKVSLNTLGWFFIVICVLSILLHLILNFCKAKTKGDN
ncbi:MAG: zinc ribbon domain-containing protein [Clostridia bacterium]|nr:zinc ribbon domain-containing protein [Clostridia bacterium]